MMGGSVAASPCVLAKSSLSDQLVMRGDSGQGGVYLFSPLEDSWAFNTVPQFPVSPATGACLAHHASGPTGTASAGSPTTLTTVLTAAINLAGYAVRITAGTGAGQENTILSNTLGANSVLTTGTWATPPDNTSVYLILSGRFWYHSGGANATRYYEVATNTWSSALATPSTTSNNESMLIATPAYYGQSGLGTGFATGTATSGSATTIVNTGKAWATNQWANYQVRITAGTGAGKVAVITSNTGTTLTFPSVTTVLDSTSVYIIEANDDWLYMLGAGAVLLQRYSISGNTWTSLVPSPVRTNFAGTGAGTTACWQNQATDALFTTENSIINGRRIYSFNSTGSSLCVDYYDIPSNGWTNAVPIGRLSTTIANTTASCGVVVGDYWYVVSGSPSGAQPSQIYRINLPRQTLDPWSILPYPSVNSTIAGQRMFPVAYTDGGTTINWIYLQPAGSGVVGPSPWFRCMII